jgi:radical SAM superfamily enzyme YgiQ (UPF0313 family)
MTIKTAIISVPRIEPHRPPAGSAIICQVCLDQEHEVSSYDLNIKFFHYCKNHNLNYYNFDVLWDQHGDISAEYLSHYTKFIDDWSDKISKENYDYIMISIFGSSGHDFSLRFLTQLRQKTSAKIICGGMGVQSTSLLNAQCSFGKDLLENNLIDCYITGEGEKSLVGYLQGRTGPGINNDNPEQITDLDSLPFPNYSYFDLDEYDYLDNKKEVFITGSRGCVRKCTYCDIERYWPKYRYRSGKNIADEIINSYEKSGITNFYFTDSLINGSLKAFEDMCNKLANYKFEEKISWQGQFIFRPKKSTPRDHYSMIQEAGGKHFYVGIESGSDRVRFDMGKKFTNEDIDYNLEEMYKNNLHVMFLMFTGYITETLDDHNENLKMFERWKKYVATGTISAVELGDNLKILSGSPLDSMIESHMIYFMPGKDNEPVTGLWYSDLNPELNIIERIRRKIEVHETAIKNYWPVWRQYSRLHNLKQFILSNDLHNLTESTDYLKIIKDSKNKRLTIPISIKHNTSKII